MVRAIIFDLDDTLLDFVGAERLAIAKTLDTLGIPYTDTTLDRYHEINKACWGMLERGEITRDELLTHRFSLLYSEMGADGDPVKTKAIYEGLLAEGHNIIPGAVDLLDSLKDKYTLILASNGSTAIQESRIAKSGIGRFFSGIFISESIGFKKPDPDFFDYLFAKMNGIKREETIIVGDSLGSDILGGINAGITTCLYNPHGTPTAGSLRPDYEVRELSLLPALLEKINKKDD